MKAFCISIYLGCVAVAGLILITALRMSNAAYDPLGPATFPVAVAVLTMILAAACAIRTARSTQPKETGTLPSRSGLIRLLGFAILIVAFIISFNLRLLPFSMSSSIFLVAAYLLFSRNQVRWYFALPGLIGLSFLLDYIFRNILTIDLP